MTFSLKPYIKPVFDFGNREVGYKILGLVAKNGGIVEYQIVNHIAEEDRGKVNRNIEHFLLPNGFLIRRYGKSWRGIENAFGKGKKIRTKEYYLTLKGFLASLAVTKFEENYLVLKHQRRISSWFDDRVTRLAMLVIKYNIAVFLTKKMVEGSDLVKIWNIENQIGSVNEEIFLEHKLPLVNNKKLYEKILFVNTKFRIYSQALNAALRIVLNESIKIRKSEKRRTIPSVDDLPRFVINRYKTYVQYWYYTIIEYQFQDEEKINPFLINEDIIRYKMPTLKIDNTIVNDEVKKILKKYGFDDCSDLPTKLGFYSGDLKD